MRSRGGVKFSTGGDFVKISPRAQKVLIWCDSKTDGDSPDGREENKYFSYF